MRFKKLLALGWIVLVGVPLVLTACGGPSGGPGGGPTPPTEDDYVLTLVGPLDEAHFDPGARFWVRTVTAIDPDLRASYDWYQPSFPVGADGNYEIVLDAREFEGSGMSPERFGDWYLYPALGETSELTASDPAARLKAVGSVALYQANRGAANLTLLSSNLLHLHEYTIDGRQIGYGGRLVFSDRPVTISGQVGPTGGEPRVELDMELMVGWNLVHYRPASADQLAAYVVNPIDLDKTVMSASTYHLASMSSLQDATQVAGYSIFPLHQTQGGASPTSFMSRFMTPQSTDLFTPRWLKSGGSASLLVPLEQAVPGARGGGTMTLSEPDARGLFADVYYYDSAGITGTWWQDHEASSGILDLFTADDGTTVLALYSDRATQLDMDGFEVSGEGATITFEADAVELHFGWNLLRADLDQTALVARLENYSDVPLWEATTRAVVPVPGD